MNTEFSKNKLLTAESFDISCRSIFNTEQVYHQLKLNLKNNNNIKLIKLVK